MARNTTLRRDEISYATYIEIFIHNVDDRVV